nr:DUF2158 domain-containing protein [uncultured Pseudomonas sp.]
MSHKPLYGIGDLLQLKSGGPVMAVYRVHDSGMVPAYECQWFAGKKLEKGLFPEPSLEVPQKG